MALCKLLSTRKLPLNSFSRYCSSVRNVEELFINPDVQRILSSLTSSSIRNNSDAAFAAQKVKRSRSKVLMMTEDEYKKAVAQSFHVAESRMQPFPVKCPRIAHPPPGTVIHADPEIVGLNQNRFVFVDLSPTQVGQRNVVVVREPSGDLRTATEDEHSRFINIFFPQKQSGRSIKKPALFTDDETHLQLLLERSQYLYMLKRACVQFEPDDMEFIQITNKVFDHLASRRRFDTLDATPFFGNVVFHCVIQLTSQESSAVSRDNSQKLCNLLCYLMQKDRLDDVALVLRLCALINPKLISQNVKLDFAVQENLLQLFPSSSKAESPLERVFSPDQLSELNLSMLSCLDRRKTSDVEKIAAKSLAPNAS